ncbi:MAG: hypothetical protein P8J20_13735 [Novosphingobium sp.]|nr:hypothetical protein [Novosphingobium sp.]
MTPGGLFMNKHCLIGLLAAATVCVLPGTAKAEDRIEAKLRSAASQLAPRAQTDETIGIVIQGDGEILWSGTLRIGGQGGNASFSLSKNEFAMSCPGEPGSNSGQTRSSFRMNFNIGRRNWQQERDKFNVNVNWTRPLPTCEGEGSDTLGFKRVVDIVPGRTTIVEGGGGLVVRLTRQP